MRRAWPLIALSVLLLAPEPARARGAMTAGFRAPKSRPRVLAVLPARADFIESGVVATGRMKDACAALEREAAVAVRTDLEVLGYEVRLVTPLEIEKDARLRDLVTQVGDRFAVAWRGLAPQPQGLKQGRSGLGDDAARLATILKVDGLAVARVVAVAPSDPGDGREAPQAKPAASRSYGRVDVGIAGGGTGRIEAFFTGIEGASRSQLLNRPAKVMGRASEAAFSLYPASTEAGVDRLDPPLPASEKAGKGGAPADNAAALRDIAPLVRGSSAAAPKSVLAKGEAPSKGAAPATDAGSSTPANQN